MKKARGKITLSHRLRAQADNQLHILFYICHSTTGSFLVLYLDLPLSLSVYRNPDNK